MSPNASHRVRPGLSSAASLITTLLISFDQEVLNQHLNLVTPEYTFFESPWVQRGRLFTAGPVERARGWGSRKPQLTCPCLDSGRSTLKRHVRQRLGCRAGPSPG